MDDDSDHSGRPLAVRVIDLTAQPIEPIANPIDDAQSSLVGHIVKRYSKGTDATKPKGWGNFSRIDGSI